MATSHRSRLVGIFRIFAGSFNNPTTMENIHKTIMATLFFCLAFSSGFAQQVRVYKGNSSYSGDVICNLKGDKVYQGNSSYSGDVLCNLKGDKVYRGNSSYSGDILYTVRDGKVYKGSSSYSASVVFTIRDGKVYKENSSYSADIIANRKGHKVYKNNSSYSGDVDFTLSDDVTIEQFVAIWYAVKYCW